MWHSSIIVLSTALLFSLGNGRGKIVDTRSFQARLDSFQVSFTAPLNFNETRTKSDLRKCSFAIKSKTGDMVILYCLFPFEERLKKFNECSGQSVCLVPTPQNQFKEIFNSLMLEVSNATNYELLPYTKEELKEVNADEGGRSLVPVKKKFNDDFVFAEVSYFTKSERVDVVIIKLSRFELPDFKPVPAGLIFK